MTAHLMVVKHAAKCRNCEIEKFFRTHEEREAWIGLHRAQGHRTGRWLEAR